MSSENWLSDVLVEQSPDAIVFADLQGNIAVWSVAAERIFGFTKEEALGASLDIIIPDSFREAHWRGFKRAISDRETKYVGQSLPTKSLRSDGSTIYVELSFSIVLDSAGNALGALSSARDITERFEEEKANRRKLQKLENVPK